MNHIVAISGGKDSTAMALRLAEIEPRDYTYLITPVGNELPEMVAHWENLERVIGKQFIRIKPFTKEDGLRWLIDNYNALPNHRQRWCTRQLKIEPTIAYLKLNSPCIQYVGLRADEETRGGIYGDIPGVQQCHPLKDWGWGLEDVIDYLFDRGVKVPRRTDCAWCYAQRIIDWKRLWQNHPDLYEQAVKIEAETGYTFRSPSRDTWPAGLAELRQEFEAGRKVKGENTSGQLSLFEINEDQGACRVCSL